MCRLSCPGVGMSFDLATEGGGHLSDSACVSGDVEEEDNATGGRPEHHGLCPGDLATLTTWHMRPIRNVQADEVGTKLGR